MKKVSISNIIISIIIVIIAGVLFYNNRYNISNDMDNIEMYVMLRNMEVNANTQWQEFPAVSYTHLTLPTNREV